LLDQDYPVADGHRDGIFQAVDFPLPQNVEKIDEALGEFFGE
jgi:hypothetical protein